LGNLGVVQPAPPPDYNVGLPLHTVIALDQLRRSAVAASSFPPTSLEAALQQLGYVQADPIRAPARAQDLILRHRVIDYRAGDLERQYARLDIEEDVFINYGFVTRALWDLMHPRAARGIPVGNGQWPLSRRRRAQQLLDFVRERGEVHPREVDAHFSHGTVRNYWGGSSNATTHLLDAMQYVGLVRVARRDRGIRVFTARQLPPEARDAAERRARIDALVDAALRLYAPLPGLSLSFLVRRLRYAVPQWHSEITAALTRARRRLSSDVLDGVHWYWPAGQPLDTTSPDDAVRLLAPFDPIVWDRRRFELLWGWGYRFEAYTPVAKRQRGYYALPLLWRDRVIGWANLSIADGKFQADLGFIKSRPREAGFRRELDAELYRIQLFLGLTM
jgi:uncharacterized protein YcaQ